MIETHQKQFTTYEYKEMHVHSDQVSFYLDSYESFGWHTDENFPPVEKGDSVTLRLKRSRKIVNRAELTRLQRHFEADIDELKRLEDSKRTMALIVSLAVGLAGTALTAGSVFAITATPPIIWLCAVLGFLGIAGWIAPYFIFRSLHAKKAEQLAPIIDAKYEEIYELCEKGQALL